MDGLPVGFGETISRTGIMLVQCDNAFDLYQDGVKWYPVGMESGAFEYVLSSNGRVSIVSGGKEVFFFRSEFTPDFVAASNSYGGFRNSEGQAIQVKTFGDRYYQGSFVVGYSSFFAYLYNVDVTQLQSLEKTTSRGNISIEAAAANTALVYITGFGNVDTPLWAKIGNVMIAFFEPIV